MEELIEKFCAKYGVDKSKFEATPMTDTQRMDELEQCILELAEIIGGEQP